MEVIVQHKIFSLLYRKYIVTIDNEKRYIIQAIPFRYFEYQIKDYQSLINIGEMTYELKLRADAKISIWNKEYVFSQEKWDQMIYDCVEKNSSIRYRIQGNHGIRTSVYKSGEQIAYWEKKNYILLSGVKYSLQMNYDEDPVLLSLFAILVDKFRKSLSVGGGFISWEVGNMGKGLTEFDKSWKSKMPDDNRVR